jgi:hypothetical protein
MLFRAQIRNTAEVLLKRALTEAGAQVVSSKDTPATDDNLPLVGIYADDSKSFVAPRQSRTTGELSIEVAAQGKTRAEAQAALDMLCDTVEQALFGAKGIEVTASCTQGGAVVTLSDDLDLLPGLLWMGAGVPEGTYIASMDGTEVTLSARFEGATGDAAFIVGAFVELFEQIDSVKTFTDFAAGKNRTHIASASVEIVGHATEFFEPAPWPALTGLNVYIDSLNNFDAAGTYEGKEPFAVPAPPRTTGPDGNPEIAAQIDLPQE